MKSVILFILSATTLAAVAVGLVDLFCRKETKERIEEFLLRTWYETERYRLKFAALRIIKAFLALFELLTTKRRLLQFAWIFIFWQACLAAFFYYYVHATDFGNKVKQLSIDVLRNNTLSEYARSINTTLASMEDLATFQNYYLATMASAQFISGALSLAAIIISVFVTKTLLRRAIRVGRAAPAYLLLDIFASVMIGLCAAIATVYITVLTAHHFGVDAILRAKTPETWGGVVVALMEYLSEYVPVKHFSISGFGIYFQQSIVAVSADIAKSYQEDALKFFTLDWSSLALVETLKNVCLIGPLVPTVTYLSAIVILAVVPKLDPARRAMAWILRKLSETSKGPIAGVSFLIATMTQTLSHILRFI